MPASTLNTMRTRVKLADSITSNYEGELARARETALAEMQDRAREQGANAVVGVDLDYEVINNMLMVSASGTAVTVE